MVARFDTLNGMSNAFDDPGGFMAENDGKRSLELPLDHFEIGVAEARGLYADKNIGVLHLCELNVFDLERLSMAM
jgi:hypothetical protein